MAKEYIEREAVIEAIKNDCLDLVYYGKEEAIWCVKAEPAADVKEVVHGEWIEDGYEGCIVCSYCGVKPLSHEDSMYTYCLSRFCPNCGADMRGRKE